MTTLQTHQSNLFQAQCELLFSCIEQQSSLGISVQEIQWMPKALAAMLPVKTQTFEWRGLIKLVRVFDPAQAQAVLLVLGFEDFPAYLVQHGYNQAKQEFIQRLQLHVQSEQAKLMSLF